MKARAKEAKDEERANRDRAAGEKDLLASLRALPDADRALATRVHEIVSDAAPGWWPRTWYGMPAWARDGKVVCFVQPASKFKSRYATFGFTDQARLDDGNVWPTSFALKTLAKADEAFLRRLVERAAG